MTPLVANTLHCPGCSLPLARHRRLVGERVRELTCKSCGAQVEVRLQPWSYYWLKAGSLLGWQVVPFVIIVLALVGQWAWLAVICISAILFETLRGFVARRGAEIRWINEESMRRRAAGRWLPE